MPPNAPTKVQNSKKWYHLNLGHRPSGSSSGSTSQPSTPGVGGTTVNHTSPKTPNEKWIDILRGLIAALEVVEKASAVPPLQATASALSLTLKPILQAGEQQQEHATLLSDLREKATLLQEHLRESTGTRMASHVENTVQSLQKEINIIHGKMEQNTIKRIFKAGATAGELVECYRRIDNLLENLQLAVELNTSARVEESLAMTKESLAMTKENLAMTKQDLAHWYLEALSPVAMAEYDARMPETARNACAEGTRADTLLQMEAWWRDPAKKIYWLNGIAGTGKTTIAYSFAKALADTLRLGASFFCTRTHASSGCQDAGRIIPTIAYQLAQHSPSYQQALCKILEKHRNVATKPIPVQFELLLQEPFTRYGAAIQPDSDTVVVIDALDQCDDHEDEPVPTLLSTLLEHARDLPFKFILTSRPDPNILDAMQSGSSDVLTMLHLHEIDRAQVQADIEKYLRAKLGSMVSPDAYDQLVRLSDRYFIYAAVMVRFILSKKRLVDRQERLQTILDTCSDPSRMSDSNEVYAELDEHYKTILKEVLDGGGLTKYEVERVRRVLWTAVCVQEPVGVQTLATLAGYKVNQTRGVLQSLGSVLHISDAEDLVTAFHASFHEFICTRERSEGFHCDEAGHAPHLAQKCFETMAEWQPDAHEPEPPIPDTPTKGANGGVQICISQSLSYACRYWGAHLLLSVPTNNLCASLDDFLSKRFHFWIEVMKRNEPKPPKATTLLEIQLWLAPVGNVAQFKDIANLAIRLAVEGELLCG